MPNPAWFIESYYAAQKVAQMNATKWGGTSDWGSDSWQGALDAYNAEHGTNITAYDNFVACNQAGYTSAITAADINVSPNEYFDVPVYLQNVANHANSTGYTAGGVAAGAWTVQNVLTHMLNDGHMSAWEHYKGDGMKNGINPSNSFDTTAYLTARAEAAGTDVATIVSQLTAAGNNPIMDFYENAPEGMTTPPAPAEQTVVEAAAGWTPWDDGTTPPTPVEVDPYEQDVSVVDIAADQLTYPGPGESYTGNTKFEAVWSSSAADRTLNVKDEITGPAGQHNTLSVNLGADWKGFTEPTVDGETVANVTNIGRLELNHTAKNSERGYTFDATGIDGLERVDINNTGAGSISLRDLTASVEQINIDTLKAKNLDAQGDNSVMTTKFDYAKGELDGKSDSLTIGLTDVGGVSSSGGLQYAPIVAEGIENLTIDSKAGSNYINLGNFSGVKSLAIKGAGDIYISKVTDGIRTYDASEATGTVNMAASDITSATVVKGGTGADTLTLTKEVAITPASWTGVETLQENAGGSVNATNVEGLQALRVNSANAFTLKNLTASDFTVTQISGQGDTTVRGEIGNLTYNTGGGNGTYSGTINSDVTTDVTINVLNRDDLGSTWEGTFKSAEGNVVLNVAEGNGKDLGSFAGTVNAKNAETFTANIDGALVDGAKFNVVDGEAAAGRTITIISQNSMLSAPSTPSGTPSAVTADTTAGITLDADGATELNITAVGTFLIKEDSSLKGLQDLKVTLDNNKDQPEKASSQFILATDLAAAQTVDINAGGEVIRLKDLGGKNNNGAIDLSINDADTVEVGAIKTGEGWNVTGNISATGDVNLGEIYTVTNTSSNVQGDVELKVATELVRGEAGNLTIAGIEAGDITLDFSGVAGTVGEGSPLVLKAQEAIIYQGAVDNDEIQIAGVGAGTTSTVSLGEGEENKIEIGMDALKAGKIATINIDCGEGNNAITFKGQTGANLTVNITGFAASGAGEDTLDGLTSITAAQASQLLKDFDLSLDDESAKLITIGGTTGVYQDGNAYLFDDGTDATVMVVLESLDTDGLTVAPLS